MAAVTLPTKQNGAPSPPQAATPPAANDEISLGSIVSGVQKEPFSIFLMGVPGVGKSTFAAGAPKPIFLDLESGTAHLPVKRWHVRGYEQALRALDVLATQPHDFETVVLDGIGRLEEWIHERVLLGTKWTSITEYGGGYGKGPEAALEHWKPVITRLRHLRERRGMHVILLGHVALKTYKNPFGADWERYVPKLQDKAASFIREIVGYVLFARFESFAVKDETDKRVRGMSSDARILHTQWNAAFDAKNRGDLPAELPLSWDAFESAVRDGAPHALARLRAELEELLPQLTDEQREKARVAAEEAREVPRMMKIVDHARAMVMAKQQSEGGV